MSFPTYKPGVIVSAPANGDVAAKRFVGYDDAQVASAGAEAKGVTIDGADDGKELAIIISGTALVTSGAAISVGASLASDANGKAVTAVATNKILGVAVTAAAGADEDIEIDLKAHPTAA